jgi:hypothetical protein
LALGIIASSSLGHRPVASPRLGKNGKTSKPERTEQAFAKKKKKESYFRKKKANPSDWQSAVSEDW